VYESIPRRTVAVLKAKGSNNIIIKKCVQYLWCFHYCPIPVAPPFLILALEKVTGQLNTPALVSTAK
jgi:hypothetical protein